MLPPTHSYCTAPARFAWSGDPPGVAQDSGCLATATQATPDPGGAKATVELPLEQSGKT